MKFKKIMLVALVLLAVLTIGAVSASDNTDFNETLTVDDVEDVSLDASSIDEVQTVDAEEDVLSSDDDQVIIDVNTDFDSESSDHFSWTHLPDGVTDGKVKVTSGESTLFESQVNIEDDHWWQDEENGPYVGGIASNEIGWTQLNDGDIIIFSFLDENDETLFSQDYAFSIDGTQVHLEKGVSSENFNWWISTHEGIEDDGSYISEVWFNDVEEGILILTIENSNGEIQSYDMTVEDTDNVHWELRDLDILDCPGTYTINLTYSSDEKDIILAENHVFTLTQLGYNVCDNVYIGYPFDVIRFYNEYDDEEPRYNVKVYVDGEEKEYSGDDPFRWTLNDFEIWDAGEYGITIEVYEGESLVEDFTYTLNVYDEFDNVLLYSDDLSVETWEIDDPILYIAYQEGNAENYTIKVYLDDELINEFDVDSYMYWTLDYLGIDHDGGYNIQLYNDDDEWVTDTWINVWCIDQFKFRTWIWNSEEDGKLYNDYNEKVISVEVPEGKEGYIKIYVGEEEIINWEIEGNYNDWSLQDLDISDVDEYEITVKYVDYDDNEEILAEAIINVIEFDYQSFRLVIDKDSETLKLYCPENTAGTQINLFVMQEIDEEESNEVFSEYYDVVNGEWMEWSLEDINFAHDGYYYSFNIFVFDDEDNEIFSGSTGHSVEGINPEIWDEDEQGPLYVDSEGNVIAINVPDGISGKLQVIVNDVVLYTPRIYPNNRYSWNLKTLNITSPDDYNVVVKLINDDETEEIIIDETFNVVEFENDIVRVKFYNYYDEEGGYISLYCPEDADAIIVVRILKENEDGVEVIETREITVDSTFYNKWTEITDDFDFGIELDEDCWTEIDGVKSNGEWVKYEESLEEAGVGFEDNHEHMYSGEDAVVTVYLPYNIPFDTASINITSGDYVFSKKLSEMEYSWSDHGYVFALTLDDVDSFESLSDKDVITFVFDYANGKLTRWDCINKEDDFIQLYSLQDVGPGPFGDTCDYGLEIIMEINTVGEDEEDEDEGDGEGDDYSNHFAVISIPDSFNVTDGAITVTSGENTIFSKKLSEIDHQYQYYVAGNQYYILFEELDLTKLNDKDMVNVTLTSDGNVLEYKTLIFRNNDSEAKFYEFYGNVEFDVHYHKLSNPEFGMGESDGSFIVVTIPEIYDINEGTVEITRENGEVIFSVSLSSFDNTDSRFVKRYSNFYQAWEYVINANETIYSLFPENENLTFTFKYDDTQISRKGIRKGDELSRVIVPYDVLHDMFSITIPSDVLVNGEDFAINIECIGANRQSIYFGLGGGHFNVYVNGVKIEDLGRLNRYEGETELDLSRLCSNTNGVTQLYIYLGDLNITDNGIYDIKVTHSDGDGQETEIFAQDVTLTSNVKVDNATSGALTGFGMDPILMYLDTYYGEIDEVTGKITVLNSDGEEIFASDIKGLSSENGRYYLKYSDFENKNFGHQVTVIYGDGNERSGNTTVNVTWQDIHATDFTPTVNDNVDDYYGDFINLNIPDLLNEGQIIVTIKFKGNHTTNIPNMNVTSDFGSQAVYRFNVADIKANYETFKLSLSDLGFYEDDGNYEIDVKFTADGESNLDVVNNTMKVEFLEDILITINETTRYTYELPFATVKVFEPKNAYVDLYIDGVKVGSSKTFEDGIVTFNSVKSWTPGVHNATIEVVHSEFARILNSSTVTFEVMTKTNDVVVSVPENVKENIMTNLTIIVPKDGKVTIKVDNKDEFTYEVVEGTNSVPLGSLSYGNRTIWVDYNTTLGNGKESFFTDYVHLFVGDDGHWLDVPEPLVLDEDDVIKVNFGSDATGEVTLWIDGEFMSKRTLVDGACEFKIIFNETSNAFEVLGAPETTKYGKHTYRIEYSGDNNGHDAITRTGEITVKYIFKDDLDKEGYPLKENYDFNVILPADATGTVRVTVNNKPYEVQVTDGKAAFKVEDLNFGEHEVFIEYLGDEKYPYANYTNILNVAYYGVVGEYSADAKYISLMLEKDATGNLTVYNDNMRTIIDTIPVIDGKARLELDKLSVGIYDIRAYYEGDDYEVRSFAIKFRVEPKVIIQQGVVMGDDGNIYLDLDNATGHIVIAMDGLSPVVQEIVNGTVNYTFSTEGYFKGNHSVTFLYFGKSFDGDIFLQEDGKTPVSYDLLVLPQNTTGNLSNNENILEVRIYREDGSLATDAGKYVTFYVNGMKYKVVAVHNGIATLDISKFKNGNYLISWNYSGDKKYASSSGQSSVNINRKIVANNANVLYSANKKYSVTVYNAEKSLAKGVTVTFLINNKVFKTVKTDSKGVASVVINKNPGTYKITAKFSDLSVTKTLKVTHVVSLKKVKVKKSAKKLVIKATLKKVNGKYLKSKKVTFKFNGKKYKAKTNKKGVAKVTIKSKVLKKLKVGKKVKYQATYLKDTVKKTVKVKK